MILRRRRYILILSLIILYGCQNAVVQDDNICSQYDLEHDAYYEWFFDDKKENIQVSAYYKNGKLNGVKKIYYRNGNVKEIHNYNDNLLVGKSQHFYQNGGVEIEQELIKYYNEDTPFINTYKYYDINGSIIEDSSYYYYYLNEKRKLVLNEDYRLKVKLNRLVYDDQLNVVTGEFEDLFNILHNKKRILPSVDGEIAVKLPTDKVGNFEYKFIINDYTYLDLDDTLIACTQYLVNYCYVVESSW
jgi:hypothetical protein